METEPLNRSASSFAAREAENDSGRKGLRFLQEEVDKVEGVPSAVAQVVCSSPRRQT